MSVSAFDFNANLPTKDAQFKHIITYGTTQLRANVYIDSYDATQPQAKALGNTGAVGYIELGANQKSFPVGIYGKDTQHNPANPNLGKLSIKPNFHSPNNIVESDEMVGIGCDDTNSVGFVMPTGMWIRSKNEAGANGYNATFSLTNIPEGGGSGVSFTQVISRTSEPDSDQYNVYFTNIGAAPAYAQTNVNLIKIEPTTANTTRYTITSPAATAKTASIVLSGNIITQNNDMAGIATLVSGTPSTVTVPFPGMTTNAVVMLTQNSGGPLPDLLYTASATAGGQFIISTTAASTATIAYNVIKL